MEEAEPKLQSTRLTRSQKRKYEQSKSDVGVQLSVSMLGI